MLTIEDIREARENVNQTARETPLVYSNSFTDILGAETLLKLENQQRTGAFKIRGATNKMSNCLEDCRDGVVTASAGNHAQGVALSASRKDIESTIFMPEVAPKSKVIATRKYGGNVVLHGDNYDDAKRRALQYADEHDVEYIPAYNDYDIIAGQGTIGLEVVEQSDQDIDLVIVPIGGGGLISGISMAVKESIDDVKVVGVEPEATAKAKESMETGEPVNKSVGMTIADGVATKSVGSKTLEIMNKYVDDVVTVSEGSICQAMTLALERAKTVVEGAGALPIAAVLENDDIYEKDDILCLPLCGGNVDMLDLSPTIEKGLKRMNRYAEIEVRLVDSPGSLNNVLSIIADGNANVQNIAHDRTSENSSARFADVNIGIETAGREHLESIVQSLEESGHEVRVL